MSAEHVRGHVGLTVAESKPWWEVKARMPHRPNILLIVFDDTGWSDFGCFGSEIQTPNIDALAAGGLRYNNFHVTPLCSPTRACLMTGRNHHHVGMRFLADIDTGFPNSRGGVDPAIPMLPQQLKHSGYASYLVGKWHLTPQHEVTPAGPFQNWPIGRGFDRFHGFMDGCTDQFTPELYIDNHPAAARSGGGAYHLTTDLAERAMTMIADHAVFRPDDPFFLTFAPAATHAPLQAPGELIDKYVPIFEKGWDETRIKRLKRQKELGVVPSSATLTERNPGVPEWSALDELEKRLFVRQQAAFAAFLEHADNEIGRIVRQLEVMGLRDDTLILVLSDNGASREGGRFGAVDINGPYSGIRRSAAEQIADLDRIGGPDGPAHYPEGWAMAGNTPFRRYKQSVDLGGVRSPLIVNWPKGIRTAGEVRNQFVHAIDIAATIVDLARVANPETMDGRSIRDTFEDARTPAPRTTQYWEMFGHRAIWKDGWKAITEHVKGTPYNEDTWRLYCVDEDFSETRDLAAENPDRLRALIEIWWDEARRNQVLPLDDRSLVELLNETASPHQLVARRNIVFWPQNSHVPVSSKLTSTKRSMRISAQLNARKAGESGIIVSSGTVYGGYILHVQNDRICFESVTLGQYFSLSTPLPPGDAAVTLELRHGPDSSASVSLLVDGVRSAKGTLPLCIGHLSFWGMDIGKTSVRPASRQPVDCVSFPEGILGSVAFEFLEPLTSEELAELMESTE